VVQLQHYLGKTFITGFAKSTTYYTAGLPGDRQRLRSSSTSALAVPLTRLSTIGDRALAYLSLQQELGTVCLQNLGSVASKSLQRN